MQAETCSIASNANRVRARLTDILIGGFTSIALAGALMFASQLFGAGHDFGAGPVNLDLSGSQWQKFALVLLVISVLVIAIIEACFVSVGKPTPGKKEKQLIVVSVVDRRPPDLMDSIIRTLIPIGAWSAGPIFAVAIGVTWPFIVGPTIGTVLCIIMYTPALIGTTHQGLHDMAARTIVVNHRLLVEDV